MKKFIVVVGCTFGLLFSLLGANGYLVASDVDASTVSHKTGNYTIDKILSSYEGEEFFTKITLMRCLTTGVLMKILKSSLMRKVVYFIL